VIVVVGVSHRTAPLAVREALAVPRERMAEALCRLREVAGLREAMLLSTCNRVEVYGRAEEPRAGPLAEALAALHARPLRELEPHLYALEGEAAGERVRRSGNASRWCWKGGWSRIIFLAGAGRTMHGIDVAGQFKPLRPSLLA
jgi:hypothetical protein